MKYQSMILIFGLKTYSVAAETIENNVDIIFKSKFIAPNLPWLELFCNPNPLAFLVIYPSYPTKPAWRF